MTTSPTEAVRLQLNGQVVEAAIDPRALLIEVIRDLGATGARAGCLTGDCGACSVEIDGRLAKSCLVLAVSAGGSAIVTIEGRDDAMARAVQDAFVRCGGFQCGFCTSGMIMVALELLGRNPDPTEAQIRAAISGNLCRCTGYEDIVRSIASAAEAYRANITNNKQRE
ncbi:(2Fe-2S)-binding protein [Rhodopseudomonas palustris]|uniref:(2Fe-2S)-binding protein n=1 Tax=Rhodopseudomonas palustris TaxID=1076 RepID=A0A418V115_RHOPL|nr:(2Fe-2S)-binding protein [Rhodopseudomonas palustris]RJF69534.1 (2Fe-2S)-binding protein [Rhodopseudomonas palustris]